MNNSSPHGIMTVCGVGGGVVCNLLLCLRALDCGRENKRSHFISGTEMIRASAVRSPASYSKTWKDREKNVEKNKI